MPLFRRSPLPGPDAPIEEHLDAIAAERAGAVHAYVRALAARDLWTAVAELPPGVGPGQAWTPTEPTAMPFLTTTLPTDTGTALQVFTSEVGVQARAPRAFPVKQPGREVLELVVAQHDGAVVDSHARWQALASAWIAEALR